jgi:hypothetical protein
MELPVDIKDTATSLAEVNYQGEMGVSPVASASKPMTFCALVGKICFELVFPWWS